MSEAGIQVNGADDPGSEDYVPQNESEADALVRRWAGKSAEIEAEHPEIAEELAGRPLLYPHDPVAQAIYDAGLRMSIKDQMVFGAWQSFHGGDRTDQDELEIDHRVHNLKMNREAKKRLIAETGGFGRFDPSDLINGEDLQADAPVEWLIEGVLEREALTMLVADSYVGKSYLAMDWAFCISAGVDWHGHKTESAKVLYLLMEGGKSVNARRDALEEARGVDLEGQGDYLQFNTKVVNFMDDSSVEAVADYVKANGVELVVIDTLSRAISGAAENSPEDMGAFVMAVSRIREANPKGSVLILHHTNRTDSKQYRGHSSLFAAMDTVMCLWRENERTPDRTLIFQKVKSGTPLPDMAMKFVSVKDSAVLEPDATVATDVTLRLLMGMQIGGKTVTRAELKEALMKAENLKAGSANNRITDLVKSGDILADGPNVSTAPSAGAKP